VAEEKKIEQAPAESAVQKKKISYAVIEVLQMVLLALGLYFAVDVVVARVRVEKTSMKPTVQVGEILLVNKLAYKLGEMKRGDILTFHFPLDPELDYIKRVIGLAGDEVRMSGGEVYVNGQVLEEPYINERAQDEGVWQVSAESIFVLGDNRVPSADSRAWGFVPLENVIGKALAVYWPPGKVRLLQHIDVMGSGD